MAKSDTILGRKLNQMEFGGCWATGGSFTVSVYPRRWRRGVRYTDPVDARAGVGVLYRIRITPKRGSYV